MEMPGLQLVHGQSSASTRRRNRDVDQHPQLPNRLGKNANVYLCSAELAAIASRLGRIPTVEEYHTEMA